MATPCDICNPPFAVQDVWGSPILEAIFSNRIRVRLCLAVPKNGFASTRAMAAQSDDAEPVHRLRNMDQGPDSYLAVELAETPGVHWACSHSLLANVAFSLDCLLLLLALVDSVCQLAGVCHLGRLFRSLTHSCAPCPIGRLEIVDKK